MQLWLIAGGYAAVLTISAGLVGVRYLQEISHPADVAASGGMYAFGDLILAIFIACLFMIPTFFLLRVMARSEALYTTYSQLLLGISLSAPVCLSLLSFPKSMPESLGILCQYRLFSAPLILVGIGISRLLARFAGAKRLIAYAFLVEVVTMAFGIALLLTHR
jgi:hypothetical protein